MDRREALTLLSRIAATAAGQSFFNSWLASAHDHESQAPPSPERWRNYIPQFFSTSDFHTLDEFTSILIPTDETPGAREAHVAPFIDFLLANASEYAPEMQKHWRAALEWLNANEFSSKNTAQQIAFLTTASQPADANFVHFRLMKDLTVFSFYTSRAGLIDNLQYQGLAYLTEFPGCTHPEHQR